MDEPRCPICAEPLGCGKHRIETRPSGESVLICPAFTEFVVDGSPKVRVQLPEGYGTKRSA
jgi:hypothetical protein